MTTAALLEDAFGRIQETVHEVLDDLAAVDLGQRLDDDANSIAWLLWHLTRTQDDHVAAVAGTEQVWTADGWARRFALPFDDGDIGYGHDTSQVAAVTASAELLRGYLDAVSAATSAYVRTLAEADLARVVDDNWDPPVTLGVRLVSVLADNLQHAGQAAYVKGILGRR
ncbi:MAG TPA: DUF664 domain-containing protein [Acidimicrobiales bacterium]|nr:DUF664 domain-containing protein [Acidimicrobiales bacterium]